MGRLGSLELQRAGSQLGKALGAMWGLGLQGLHGLGIWTSNNLKKAAAVHDFAV